MKRAAVYMRVSTARQEEEQTIENQRMELEQRIKADDNLLLPDCIYKDDGWTGTVLERPDLDRMRGDARDHKFDILYFYDRGRVARRFVFQEIVFDELRECGIEFISLHDINGSSPEEMFMGNIMGMFAEYEKIKITERMRLGKIRKVKENKKLLGYNPKYGYDYHNRIKTGPKSRDGYFSINKKQAAIVEQIYIWISENYSKHEVRRMLYEHGISPPKGKRDMWSGGTLDRLLRDSTYYGKHYYNKSESVPTKNPRDPDLKYRKVTKGSRKPKPKEEWLPIDVPPIISKDLFDRVQAKLALHKRINSRNNKKNEYLLNGIVECVCGKARTGDPGGTNHTYYRCTDRLSKFPMPRECYEGSVNAPVLDTLVWRKLKGMLVSPKLIQKQAERWLKTASPLLGQAEMLKERLQSLESEERRYIKAYGLNVMSERLYKEQATEIMKKRDEFNAELSKIELDIANKPNLTPQQLVERAQKILQRFDFTDKKSIVRKIVDRIVATQKEIIIWGHIPILATEQVGLHAEHRYCRFAKCR